MMGKPLVRRLAERGTYVCRDVLDASGLVTPGCALCGEM